jgi:peptidoglycan/xylan/chitin deacetylase (PgdA/CDA1 family)
MPRIARFYGGAAAAISLEFDDAMRSQVENALPALNARRIRGTFFINPGGNPHPAFAHEIPRQGHEIGNHTWSHRGARDVVELEEEVCKAAEALVLGRPRLMSFARPGGVPWEVSPEEVERVLRRHRLLLASDRNFFKDDGTDPLSFVDAARREGGWRRICFHGIGGEWLPNGIPVFTRLLDDLVRRRDVWIAPSIEIAKYVRERDAIRPLRVRLTPGRFSLRVDCDPGKLETYGLPVAALWDHPLTIEFPTKWGRFEVRQAGHLARHRVRGEMGRFDVRPNRGVIHVKRLPSPLPSMRISLPD